MNRILTILRRKKTGKKEEEINSHKTGISNASAIISWSLQPFISDLCTSMTMRSQESTLIWSLGKASIGYLTATAERKQNSLLIRCIMKGKWQTFHIETFKNPNTNILRDVAYKSSDIRIISQNKGTTFSIHMLI